MRGDLRPAVPGGLSWTPDRGDSVRLLRAGDGGVCGEEGEGGFVLPITELSSGSKNFL